MPSSLDELNSRAAPHEFYISTRSLSDLSKQRCYKSVKILSSSQKFEERSILVTNHDNLSFHSSVLGCKNDTEVNKKRFTDLEL